MTMWRMRIVYQGYQHTLRIYDISFPLQQWLHERAWMLRHSPLPVLLKIFTLMPRPCKGRVSQTFPHQHLVYDCLLSPVRSPMSGHSHLSPFDDQNNIWWRVQIINIFTMKFYLTSPDFLLLRSKWRYQHPFMKLTCCIYVGRFHPFYRPRRPLRLSRGIALLFLGPRH